MSHSWLTKKRKGELAELAEKAGLPALDGLLKDDLVNALEDHLNANETTYAKKPDFRDYYGGRNGSPIKREQFSPSDAPVVTKTRRRTIVKTPSEEFTPDILEKASERIERASALVARTPRAVSRRVSQVVAENDFPASPAQLAEVADQSFQVVKQKTTELWDRTRVDYFKELIRENASSVATIQMLILLIEASGLQLNTLQTMPGLPLPSAISSHANSEYLFVPNILALLTSDWWAPATLWSLTSWVLPLVFSYFFNLTLRTNTMRKSSDRQYPTDPFVFNIIKAILAYSAYRIPTAAVEMLGEPGSIQLNNLGWGPFSEQTVGVVRNNVPGGYHGLQIGAVVGILVSLYDAALKK